jgi:1-pyrroline-5-carboxylate dehydrogenase
MIVTPFRNEPPMDFSDPTVATELRSSIVALRSRLPLEHRVLIGGELEEGAGWIESRNPAQPSEVIGRVPEASGAQAERALRLAWEAFGPWSRQRAEERAGVLLRAAAVLRRRRLELAALEVLEAAKPYAEADGDVCEAIDFLEFYARAALELERPLDTLPWPGESNVTRYRALGAGVVLPPWNFPLAIFTGMVAGPLAMGNTVVAKPTRETPLVAFELAGALAEAGLPPGVLNVVTGGDIEVGERLVRHPLTRFVSFTGSRAVGEHIWALAANVVPGQRFLKRVVAEMGGKDAIIVDESADLDRAGEAIVQSAFGFAGQKCSACSRVIATSGCHDALLERVVAMTSELRLGPAEDPSTDVSAVISAEQLDRITAYLELAPKEGRVVTGGARGPSPGWFVEPTVVAGLAPSARIASEEIFGPVLGFLEVPDFERALDVANDTDYGLVGGVFSRDREHLAMAREHFEVGNLYLNRKCTGALVGVQPFGGFRLSGTDAKTGTVDYLRNFAELRTVTERL